MIKSIYSFIFESMVKKYYDTLCTISRKWVNTVRWSQVETIINIYTNIYCAIYKQTKRLTETIQAIETDSNEVHMVIDWWYNWILIWDVVTIANLKYQIMSTPLENKRSNWLIDNYEFTIKRTT